MQCTRPPARMHACANELAEEWLGSKSRFANFAKTESHVTGEIHYVLVAARVATFLNRFVYAQPFVPYQPWRIKELRAYIYIYMHLNTSKPFRSTKISLAYAQVQFSTCLNDLAWNRLSLSGGESARARIAVMFSCYRKLVRPINFQFRIFGFFWAVANIVNVRSCSRLCLRRNRPRRSKARLGMLLRGQTGI